MAPPPLHQLPALSDHQRPVVSAFDVVSDLVRRAQLLGTLRGLRTFGRPRSDGTGIALAAINVGLFAWLRSDMRHGQTRLEDCLLALVKAQARTSGLLVGLGLTGRALTAAGAGD